MAAPRDCRARRKNRHYISPIIEELRSERMRRGLTGQQLADRAGYSVTAVEAWETGLYSPNLRHLEDWAAALGATITVAER